MSLSPFHIDGSKKTPSEWNRDLLLFAEEEAHNGNDFMGILGEEDDRSNETSSSADLDWGGCLFILAIVLGVPILLIILLTFC